MIGQRREIQFVLLAHWSQVGKILAIGIQVPRFFIFLFTSTSKSRVHQTGNGLRGEGYVNTLAQGRLSN